MFRFLLGFVLGALVATWYQQTQGELDIDRRFAEMQERANAVLNESRRILEETRRELQSAFEAGKRSVEQKAERLRHAAVEPGPEGTTGGPQGGPGEA